MIGLILEGVLGFAMESARCKQLKETYVGPAVDIVRFQGWASPHRLNSQLGLSQRDARFVLLVACQRGLIFQAVNGRFYLTPAQPEPRPSRPEAIRLLVRDSLTGLGYLPTRDDPEMVK